MNNKNKFEILPQETYLKMIENAIGTKLFNSIIVNKDGQKMDLLQNGEYSCAFFVSGILFLNLMIPQVKTTVNNLESLLQSSDKFEKVDTPKPGDIVFWEKILYEDDTENRHVGFVWYEDKAISTNYKQSSVVLHDLIKEVEKHGVRNVESFYRYKFD
jgi:hypothetical protein